ncbi:MAG TPA: tetratricopeptide repeat protein [Patescibacteria group bacterium]|nr:tetratricopeptide repeat protein [Patescibacteria group bacterium]
MIHPSVRVVRLLFFFSVILFFITLGWGVWSVLIVSDHQKTPGRILADESFEKVLDSGKRFVDLRKFDLAVPYLKAAVAKNTDHDEAQTLLAVCYYNLREYQKARAIYEKLLSKSPNQASLMNVLGNTIRDMGDISSAETQYRNAIAADPEFIVAYSNLAYLLRNAGKLDEARSVISQGLIKNPQNEALENVKKILQ